MPNLCIRCGEEVGNTVFYVCDNCWAKKAEEATINEAITRVTLTESQCLMRVAKEYGRQLTEEEIKAVITAYWIVRIETNIKT